MAKVQLVWFKRDLRTADHAPLYEAAQRGPVICLYVYEPSLIARNEFSSAHQLFINDSLFELRESLRTLGGELTLRVGEMPEVLERLAVEQPFEQVWAHEETGTYASYERDRQVRAWAKGRGLPFTELPANGVVRRLESRDAWLQHWHERMKKPLVPSPEHLVAPPLEPGRVQALTDLGLPPNQQTETPSGGERQAHALLNSFLFERGQHYRPEMSSPVTAFESSSRLSPYLAWGNLSVRQVYQAALARQLELRRPQLPENESWLRSLTSFTNRLRWQGHFIQKLEDQPDLEFTNTNRGFDGLREEAFNRDHFEAWRAGQTGFPMVDACMRCLDKTGWLNFRMRAMLVSFAAYQLWLHWREPGLHLAGRWIDFEPGIHWAQMQMQSGVTGINTLRIYSPSKQVLDHDPKGVFIKRWVPELREVPDTYLSAPHTMPTMVQGMAACTIGKDYPYPIVDPKAAYAKAKARMAERKFSLEVQKRNPEVYARHGSRATSLRRRAGW